MTDADHEELERLIREAEARGDSDVRWQLPAGYQNLGYSDKVHWDSDGHVYINDVKSCCTQRWSRLWHGLTGDHR